MSGSGAARESGNGILAGEKESVAFMAGEAAERALQNAGLDGSSVEMVLAATMSAEQAMPGIAAQVQQRIGAGGAASFDINSACTGFLAALNTAQATWQQGSAGGSWWLERKSSPIL